MLLVLTFWGVFGVGFVPSAPASEEAVTAVASDPEWHRLLHYRRGWFGLRSEVDGKDFFLASDSGWTPETELRATIKALGSDEPRGRFKRHARCAFPGRVEFLRRKLGIQVPDRDCPEFKLFMDGFGAASSATLVFSTAYPNNPGSMFGHTFLRISAGASGLSEEKKRDLMDLGISYAAAVADDENGLAFAVLGLGGGYLGRFSVLPYYAKVNEYNHSESRDVWEYALDLNAEQTKRLLLHAWELETNSNFRYFFLDENCAYQILALLEVARPDWDLTHFPVFVIPAETVKRLTHLPGAVRDVKFRPSLRRVLVAQDGALPPSERKDAQDVAEGRLDAAKVVSAPVLETAVTRLYYAKSKNQGQSDEEKQRLVTILRARSHLNAPKFDPSIPADDGLRPDYGHDPTRLTLYGGSVFGSPYVGTEIRSAFHDLLDSDVGYTRFSHINFPGAEFRYFTREKRFHLERIQAVAVTSLFPLTNLDRQFSWRFAIDYHTPRDYGCDNCHLFRFETGGGAAVAAFQERALAYALLLIHAEGGDSLREGYRVGPKGLFGVNAQLASPWKLGVQFAAPTDLFQSGRRWVVGDLEVESSLRLARNWSARVLATRSYWTTARAAESSALKVSLQYYF